MLQMFSEGKSGVDRHGAAARVPGSRVVDILAEGVEGSWTPATHLKIMKVGRYCFSFGASCLRPCDSGKVDAGVMVSGLCIWC